MPRARKSPAYQWYPRDYMADALVVAMTLEQEGAYRRLMDVCWLEHGLPNDIDQLWRLAKAPSRDRFARRIWPIVGRKFQPRKGKLQHRRLDRERAKQAKYRKQKQLAALARWHKEGCTCIQCASRVQCPSSSSASTSPSADLKNKIKSTDAARRDFHRPEDTGTHALYQVIATEAHRQSLTENGSDSISNVAEHFKALCAKRNLTYDSTMAAEVISTILRGDLWKET
jgi:uncharacterized protein YdaU (DUF1376 family)